MLDLAITCKGKVAIVCNCVDRLQRNYDATPTLENLRKLGKIEVHFINENLVITKDSRATDLTFWNMHVLMANFQVNHQTEKVKDSQKKLWEEGHWLGLAPIGYLNGKDEDTKKATLIIDEQRAPIIKILFEEYATGLHSLQSLWYKSRELGLTSKEKNHFEESKNFNKRTFVSRNKIEDILKNPFYYGIMRVKGNLLPHIYGPIISKALFDKVQEVLQSKSRDVFSHQQEYKAIQFAFRGLIKCDCGCTITPEHKIKKNGKRYVYLKCSHLHENCNQGLVNENTLFEQLDNELFSKIQIPARVFEALKKNVLNNLEEEAIMNANLKRNLQTELQILVNKEDNLTDLYVSGKIKEDIYNRQINAIAKERTFLEESIAKYKEITKDIKATVDNLLDIVGNLSDIMHNASPNKQNKLLKLLIKDCTLHGKKLKYTVRAPFDKFIKCDSPTQWFKHTTQDLETYAKIADEVKMVKQQVLVSC
ncbi:MAG: recombinase family protein [Alphaproteobacteria bacterium]|nr:recombinase family protein [Alphaproteobacteria bacterium]